MIFLSITVITGMAGQISLCQATFAAVGGFATAQLVHEWGLPVLLDDGDRRAARGGGRRAARDPGAAARRHLPRAGHVRVRADVRQHLRAARLGRAAEPIAVDVPRPEFARGRPARSSCFSVAVLAVVGAAGDARPARARPGRFLDALRGSETAARRDRHQPGAQPRVVAFALSAGIAGLGGGLLAMLDTQANYAANYSPFFGLVWLVLVVTISARTVEGAVVAGFALRAASPSC